MSRDAERGRPKVRLWLALLVMTAAVFWLLSSQLTTAVGRSLICDAGSGATDAILIENFDPNYVLFEHARRLRETGVAARVLVPVPRDGTAPNVLAAGIADLMARLSRLGPFEVIPVRLVEPISLNAARDIRDFMRAQGLRSVTVVTPQFRSRRSHLVYGAVLEAGGIRVRCVPVGGSDDARTWTHTWHGIQGVTEQWLKLQYYRLYVLPFRSTVKT